MFASDLQNSELAGLCSLDRNLGLPRSSNGIYQCGQRIALSAFVAGLFDAVGGSQAGINGLIGRFSLAPLLLGQQGSFVRRLFQIGVSGPVLQVHMFLHAVGAVCSASEESRHGLAIDNNQLKLDAVLDPLTATLNRRGFMNGCQAMRCHRCGLIMPDIDHFKAINDVHGHQVGDEVLVRVAAALQSQLRASDLICRWGGEEFLVMVQLAGSSQQAQDNLQKLAGTRESRAFSHLGPVCAGLDQVTISAGARMLLNGMDFQACVDEADQALLQAKRSGRNRVGCRQNSATRSGFDASMAQPGGELGDVQGMASSTRLSLCLVDAARPQRYPSGRWCQPCPHAATESLWHLDHRGDEDVSQHTLNELHRLIASYQPIKICISLRT